MEAPPRSRRGVSPALAIVAALAVTIVVSSVGRSVFAEVEPTDIAKTAVEAAADRNETRLAKYTGAAAADQLIGLVGEGAEVVSVAMNAVIGGDAYKVEVQFRGPQPHFSGQVQLLLEPVEGRWVVVEAQPAQS